ncbi:MAG: hypothetical protein C4536_12970 [Actinobacteria bacterium]|jgi:hypothetical protein|nr:MAG: hypothetical protein C4536_12970 [Actinomycetota bacterium]
MKLPKHIFKDSSESLKEILETNRQEEEARRARFKDFALSDFFLNLRSRDKLTKARVRRALPARDDGEVVDLAERLMNEASSDYLQLRMQWQREAVGYLTSLGAEAFSRQGGGEWEIPDGLDYVGMQAEGTPERWLEIGARRIGNFAGLKSKYLMIKAETVGDYCFRRARCCRVEAEMAGKCLGEEGEELRLQVREAGDWLMLKSKRCFVDARKVGRLAGLDSHNLEMHVHSAGAELGARARDAVIYVYREAKSLGLRGSGVVYMRHGTPPWRTSFRVEKIP